MRLCRGVLKVSGFKAYGLGFRVWGLGFRVMVEGFCGSFGSDVPDRALKTLSQEP